MSEYGDPGAPDATGPDSPVAEAQGAVPAGPPPAGDQSLSENAQRELAQLGGLPMADHPGVYQGIHAELQAALAAIDDA